MRTRKAVPRAWASVRDAEAAPPFQVISLPRSNLGPDVAQLSRNFGWTILDGPPAGAEIARACIAAADQVLLPVEPSALSAWAADLTVEQVQAGAEFQTRPAGVVCGDAQDSGHGHRPGDAAPDSPDRDSCAGHRNHPPRLPLPKA